MERAYGRVLFSNDTTNIETCVSPYSPKPFQSFGEASVKPFTDETLRAAVDETAHTGIDVHMLQPGLGWVPWWRSDVYPFEAHIQFMKRFGKSPADSGFARYMAEGGDMVRTFAARCREDGLSPFISFRMNDSHGHEFSVMKPEEIPGWAWHAFCPVHVDHPEWRLGGDIRSWNARVLNWAIPEVRAYKLALIREIIEKYDIDGMELDFMRHFCLFDVRATPSQARREIMNSVIREVREALDRSSAPGKRRALCVRVPCFLEAHDALGMYLPDMVRAGVDMVNLSASYFTVQQVDLARVCTLIPGTPVYLELCHTTLTATKRLPGVPYDNFLFRRTTKEQYETAAHLAYARGAYGVSAFNFAYYREHGVPGRGPFAEPPFHVFAHLGDPIWLAKRPQHYVLAATWPAPPTSMAQLPARFEPGKTRTFWLDMAPPQGGWSRDGRLRIASETPMAGARFSARMNGVPLSPTDDVSEPYPNPYPNLLGDGTTTRAFELPGELLQDCVNRLSVLMEEGEPVELNYVDIAISSRVLGKDAP